MRSLVRAFMVCLGFFVLGARAGATELRHEEDATLRAVFFIDQKEGWVVGDEGVILHTLDGGKTWGSQPSGLRTEQHVSLRSVHFLTPRIGWVVGRAELPYGMGSAGVVLFTSDGGLEWKQQLANTLPGLNQVRFVDLKTGYLLGEGSHQFPAGVFRTRDSGKTWEPLAGPRTTGWLAGDFYNGDAGILAGAWSRLGTLQGGKAATRDLSDSLDGRDVTSLQILPRKTLAAGQGGLILTSQSGGAAWKAETKWPTEMLANLDFQAMHAVKDQVWIAGRPGSVILRSTDAGANWTLHRTGQTLPLHGIFFFDEATGWAVGAAGTILHSSDGGKNWMAQHQGGKRAAGLCIHGHDGNAPVDTLARLGAAEGYLMTSLRITTPDPATIARGRAHDARRYASAMRRAGALTGETLWHFPLPQHLEGCDKKTILAHWNQLHKDDRASEELIRQLVLTLRIWRPSVLISEDPESKIPLSALVSEAVQEAVRRAADPRAFPEQIDELGLQAWQVLKVFAQRQGTPTTLTLHNDEPNLRLRATVGEFALAAQALLTDKDVPLPSERGHQRLSMRGEKITAERHWMEGLELPVGEARRDIAAQAGGEDHLLQTILQRRGAIAQAENLDDPARTLALIPIALEKLPDAQAAPAAFAIASRLAERGQWLLAQEVYLYLVDRYPYHPLSAEAYRWLLRHNTSGEARRRQELKHFAAAGPLAIARKNAAPLPAGKPPIVQVEHEEPASSREYLSSRSESRQWNKASKELGRRLGGHGALYVFDPALQFSMQAARRQLNEGNPREWLTNFRKYIPGGPWHEAAQMELWLGKQEGDAPRRIGRSRYTEVRPYLDGKFDDPCWKDARPLVLDNAVGATTSQYPTEAMFAFDQEFLYVALKCQHPAGQQVAPVKPRPRNAEVDAFDRVSLLIDLDRDYATYYHLEVDQRGAVRASCWGDQSWNPRWFVAVHHTDTCWQIEAAIPLTELTGERITAQTAWAFNVVRILPGRGVQSWSQPADVRPCPEGMSTLLFQMGAARPMMKEE